MFRALFLLHRAEICEMELVWLVGHQWFVGDQATYWTWRFSSYCYCWGMVEWQLLLMDGLIAARPVVVADGQNVDHLVSGSTKAGSHNIHQWFKH